MTLTQARNKRPHAADWDFALNDVTTIGHGLHRPECVLATRRGDLFVAALGHGVAHIRPDGAQQLIGDVGEIDGQPWIPNGIVLERQGSFLITNMGQGGGLWRLHRDGALDPVIREVDGITLPATNFVLEDSLGRLWVTVSTRLWPISKAFSPLNGPIVADGFLFLIDDKGARVVADNLAFANEVRIDASGRHIYVAETYARRITRFAIGQDGSLSSRSVFTQFGHGSFPDGIAFDVEDQLWVVSMASNRLFRVAPDGAQTLLLEDNDPGYVANIENLLAKGALRREDVQKVPSEVLRNIASLTFGGPDLKTIYLGSLGGDSVAVLRSPVAGRPLKHWDY